MSIFLAIFLGIVQGIAEFLPVSSSGHLSVFQNLLKISAPDDSHMLFDVMLHLGTFVSICFSFRRDIRQMLGETAQLLRDRDSRSGGTPPTPHVRLLLLIVIASLPLFIALPFYKQIRTLFFSTGFIGFMLIATGIILYASGKLVKPKTKTERGMTVPDALLIGLAQMMSLIPGLSRSGATVSLALARGAERDFAVKFSLLLSLPAVLGAAVVTFWSAIKSGIDWSAFPLYLLGFVISAAVGVFAISFLRSLMARNKWGVFSYYCFAAGALTIILSIIF
ncbi:MAG: undecaprenyl-diphosphate phosphatase [Oscillospiraceae bacterium]|jgi:undecaprenyl-diphosphatase|nr:undecaprenyl-diphosphate phosphatase [Oscillospiraceae bacterium]